VAPPDNHCAVSGARHVSRPLAPVAVDRWIRPLPSVRCTPDSPVPTVRCTTGQTGATAWERLSVASLRRLSGCPTGQSGAHRTTLSGAPPGAGWQPASWVPSLISSGFFCSWVLDSYASFYVFFWGVESSLPWSNSLRILWTTNTNTRNLLVHRLCCSSNTKTQLAKWPGVLFPYNLPLFGDWWQHNQSKQIIQVIEWKYAI
jgi:hypothetical protein